jgi:hypothetical protein
VITLCAVLWVNSIGMYWFIDFIVNGCNVPREVMAACSSVINMWFGCPRWEPLIRWVVKFKVTQGHIGVAHSALDSLFHNQIIIVFFCSQISMVLSHSQISVRLDKTTDY